MSVLFSKTKRKRYLRFCTAARERIVSFEYGCSAPICISSCVSLSMKRRRPFKLTHTYENEFRNAMPDNEIENISNKCQKSGASERKIKHVRKRDLNGVQKNIVTCF